MWELLWHIDPDTDRSDGSILSLSETLLGECELDKSVGVAPARLVPIARLPDKPFRFEIRYK
jgi:hypothetical protein